MIDKVSECNSFVEYLNAVAATVSASLISPSAFSSMAAVAQMLPATLAYNMFGFECRMGQELPQADFSVQATAAYGRDILAGINPTSSLSASLLTDPIWRHVQDLATRWADPRSGLNRAVDNVWLEFDLDGPVPGIPRPSVFLGLALYGQDETGTQAYEARLDGYRTTVETMARLLSGYDLPARVLGKLTDCLGTLSQDEYVFQVGLMLARGAEAVRLCIRLRSTERTLEYLTQVGWAGSESDLRGILELARSVDYTWLDLDVGETVHHKMGLECYFERHRQPWHEPRWATFLDALVQNGLCTAVKRDALLAYAGYTDENSQDVPWPAALRRASQLLDGRSLSTFVRTLHHVKIVHRPGEPLEAKAYLAANHHWHTSGRGSAFSDSS
jgi:hypothetical protein